MALKKSGGRAKKAAAAKKATPRKSTQKKTATQKKAAVKKATSKKTATQKKAAKKAPTQKKATQKKATRKKVATQKKAVASKATKKKATAKKVAKKKATKKKATATKTAARRKAEATPTGAATRTKAKTRSKAESGTPPASPGLPEVGRPAPEFTLTADDGSTLALSDLRGKNVVLYFYPRDNTPGCTVEACGFRDAYADIEAKDAIVLGVSKDSVKSHQGFKAKQNLPFPLLSDPEGEMIQAYGSWGEKKFMGRTSMGILRTTLVIDKDGIVRKVFPKVSVKTHAGEVLDALAELG